jgi:hypothetical protein
MNTVAYPSVSVGGRVFSRFVPSFHRAKATVFMRNIWAEFAPCHPIEITLNFRLCHKEPSQFVRPHVVDSLVHRDYHPDVLAGSILFFSGGVIAK